MRLPAAKSPYAGYRFPAEVISQAVWLYFHRVARVDGLDAVIHLVAQVVQLGALE